jgi:hypothetical protein
MGNVLKEPAISTIRVEQHGLWCIWFRCGDARTRIVHRLSVRSVGLSDVTMKQVQTPASSKIVPGRSSGGKVAGAWSWPPTPPSTKVKERVELYLYFPSGPSRRGTGRTIFMKILLSAAKWHYAIWYIGTNVPKETAAINFLTEIKARGKYRTDITKGGMEL